MKPADYVETRHHVLRKNRMVMLDGHVAVNQRSVEAGSSVRVQAGGYWGFASSADADAATLESRARRHAQRLSRFGQRGTEPLPGGTHRGEHVFRGRPELGPLDWANRLAELQSHCRQRYPALRSTRFMLQEEHHTKQVGNNLGADVLSSIQRASCHLWLVADDTRGVPVEVFEPLSCKGSLADLDLSVEALAPRLDRLHDHLQAKRHAVPARGGVHTVVLSPAMAGILAHEAMGHPCEADLVLGGAITGNLVGQRVASDCVTMVDFAHHFNDTELIVPVYADDEGTPAHDAVLIERGMLKDFMHSRETAQRMGRAPSGSARAYTPHDEPLVRMRNTAILPGTDRLDDIIAGVDDGYLLVHTGNGQADSTTEFMFAVTIGYEIVGGKLGRAIRDTTVSGNAIQVLQTVDAVSDDMQWTAAGYCGKKQPMVVSMGGPALRARAHLGGA
jgi:TldD protein